MMGQISSIFPRFTVDSYRVHIVLTALLVVSLAAVASAENDRHAKESLLDASEYRGELEEIVVIGQQPEWRQPPKQDEWRPDRFELKESTKPRLQWLPEYTKEERDNYQGVRDRTGENPEIKLFELKF